ncbi:MAG: hypothetical protein A2V81_03580 [Candidatus Abawacabacteria bacterium RBG_16_42_10]|uniref:Uncharacterized protein n=1 Tax=Candidatus Abawacabacteria bacterium RBG_16_42_10 TaxID=1817814 RepID=A0A1F4XJP6_9BACT|nr:MAG: hypothetical protein A2V81_03580 [Candidatus Abawacabacteria bacterium RBG_16_42_10]
MHFCGLSSGEDKKLKFRVQSAELRVKVKKIFFIFDMLMCDKFMLSHEGGRLRRPQAPKGTLRVWEGGVNMRFVFKNLLQWSHV